MGSASPRDGRRPAAREDFVLAGLGLVALAGAAVFVAGVLGSLAFFGQGADDSFRAWTDRPLLWAGAIAVLVAVVGLTARLVITTPSVASRAAPLMAIVVGAAVLAAGAGAHDARRHPQQTERRAVASLRLAAGRPTDLLTLGSQPADGGTAAGPVGRGPPVAVRSWSPSSCDELRRVLVAWSDAGSVHVPTSFTTSPGFSCLWFATHDGYGVRGEVRSQPATGTPTATVIVSPPGVGP